MTATQKLIATIVVIAAIGAGAYYVVTHPAVNVSGPGATNGVASSTTATSTGQGQTIKLNQPDYTKPIVFSASVSADIRSQLNAQLATLQAEIAKNPLDLKTWINLGNVHKIGGDYANAALYWEYTTSIFEGSGAPFYSLGDLYENFLHDYTKAETNYKAAITADPKNVNAYASLYTMYHYTLHDDVKAAAILEAGLKANPGNNYLLGLKSELQ